MTWDLKSSEIRDDGVLLKLMLAAVGGDGMLEVDIKANPLRSDLAGDLLSKRKGMACLGDAPGLGYEPDLEPLQKYRV